MLFVKDKIKMACKNLKDLIKIDITRVETEAVECGYKSSNIPPENGWEKLPFLQGAEKHYWLRGSFKTPAAEDGYFYVLDVESGVKGWDATNPQGILYLNGRMVAGLDVNHREVLLQPDATYEMLNYMYTGKVSNPLFINTTVRKVDIETEGLYYDLLVPLEALSVLNKNTAEYMDTLSAMERAVNCIDFRNPHSPEYYASIAEARQLMREEYYEKLCSVEGKPVVHCIGHTHIDVEWQWARNQTREKVQRSFSTVLMLMEKYPEYKFTMTQPELYRYLKEEAPEKFEELKQAVADGKWEPEGAMWVECDCNLTGGESFIRQILQGKNFFKEEFGKENKVLFLPDVFGYSAALPQILKKSGVDYFVTSKISWNDTNMMPYDSFMWEGIDGTEIYSSFITTQKGTPNHEISNYTTYVGMLDSVNVAGTWDRYQQKEFNKNTILTFGYGDGGGGPARWMLERQRRLAKGLPGLPVTKMNFLVPYLEAAQKEFEENTAKLQRTPKWVGELYLEFHRGTYTSMAKNKRGNRKSELMLQKAEALSMTDLHFGGSYDAAGLYAAWRKVLHNQFHDILPGSSILEVYEGTDVDYAELRAYGNGVIDGKLQVLAQKVGSQGGVLVYNPSGFARKGAVQIGGKTLELQEEIPAFGWKVIQPAEQKAAVTVNGLTAENKYYIMTLDEQGSILRLYDKRAEREVLLPGRKGNELRLFEDYPRNYDAWEMDATYKPKRYKLEDVATVTPIVDGSRAGFKVERKYLNSTLVQQIWLYSENPRIDFENNFDWHEKHHLMKICFPIDVHTDKATFEIQFGHVTRPTHENTSWDEAKFESCAHKWVDVSENGYGVALLNDCKYGFSCDGTDLSLTVLKCPSWPNPKADEGEHIFAYSLMPHCGSLYEAGIINEAYAFNQPMSAVEVAPQKGTLPAEFSMVSCDCKNILVETVKKAEESEDLVVRMYEAFNSRCKATVTVPAGYTKAYLCGTLENELQELPMVGNAVTVSVKNFEIVTLKFKK
ncbi:MAG: alpha-mannosidase [Clostridia bacterium]|nr:alpha-mannosidase [Clostridia bacterium]